MDTNDYPSIAGIARLSALLGVQARRVEDTVDAQLDEVERLVRAAASQDWDAILRTSEQIASQRVTAANKTIVQSARKARDAARRAPASPRASLRLAELLHACRSARVAQLQTPQERS